MPSKYQLNFYELLSIDSHADAESIGRAFRRAIQRLQQDPPESARRSLIQTSTAYQTLNSPELRKWYDAGLAQAKPFLPECSFRAEVSAHEVDLSRQIITTLNKQNHDLFLRAPLERGLSNELCVALNTVGNMWDQLQIEMRDHEHEFPALCTPYHCEYLDVRHHSLRSDLRQIEERFNKLLELLESEKKQSDWSLRRLIDDTKQECLDWARQRPLIPYIKREDWRKSVS